MPATTLLRPHRHTAARRLSRALRRVTSALAGAEARHWGTPLRDPR